MSVEDNKPSLNECIAFNNGYNLGKQEGYKLGKSENSQAFINGIVELISKNGITSIDELLEILKKGANNYE